ncbi:MAG: hypothetical protein HQL63_12395 [Magnetococcales bacterium]|nr:hypothetical protein [Magnetococcales bacterium]
MQGTERNRLSVALELVVGVLVTIVLLLLVGNVVVWGSRFPGAVVNPVLAIGARGMPAESVHATEHVRGEGDKVAPEKRLILDVQSQQTRIAEKVAPEKRPILDVQPQQTRIAEQEERSLQGGGVSEKAKANDESDRIDAARDDLLERLETLLRAERVMFETDRRAGTLFLPELFQFSLGSARLDEGKQDKIRQVLDIFSQVLPCFVADRDILLPCTGSVSPVRLEGVFIVGKSNHEGDLARRITNMNLAFGRASAAFSSMVRVNQRLFGLLGSHGQGLFRVEAASVKAAKPELLRRVEFRFLLALSPETNPAE